MVTTLSGTLLFSSPPANVSRVVIEALPDVPAAAAPATQHRFMVSIAAEKVAETTSPTEAGVYRIDVNGSQWESGELGAVFTSNSNATHPTASVARTVEIYATAFFGEDPPSDFTHFR